MEPGMLMMPLVAAVNTLLFHAMPAWSRPGILFSVSVPHGFAASPDGQAIVRRYRSWLWVSCAALAAASLLVSAGVGIALFGVHVGVMFWAWSRAWRQALPFAVSEPRLRAAALAPRNDELPGGALVAAGPFLLLAAAAVYLAFNWDRIPAEVPLHWGVDGPGNRRPKTALTVYAPILFGFIMSGALIGNAWLIVRRTRQVAATAASAAGERRFKRTSVLQLIAAAYGTAGIPISLSVAPLVTGTERIPPLVTVLAGASVALSFAFLLVLIRLGQGGQRAIAAEGHGGVQGDSTPNLAWKAGLFYFNRDDPAILVEKRMGLGWTLNFANKWAWVMMAALLGLAILVSAI